MAITTSSIDLDALLSTVPEGLRSQCECRHGDAGRLCPAEAEVRVTVVCQAVGCDCAAAVHLICHDCLDDWQAHADADGIRLRVRPL